MKSETGAQAAGAPGADSDDSDLEVLPQGAVVVQPEAAQEQPAAKRVKRDPEGAVDLLSSDDEAPAPVPTPAAAAAPAQAAPADNAAPAQQAVVKPDPSPMKRARAEAQLDDAAPAPHIKPEPGQGARRDSPPAVAGDAAPNASEEAAQPGTDQDMADAAPPAAGPIKADPDGAHDTAEPADGDDSEMAVILDAEDAKRSLF